MKLHPITLDVLQLKADIASDSRDPSNPETSEWELVAKECNEARDVGTVERLKELKLAQIELDNYAGNEIPEKESRAIARDLCRAGFFPEYNPNAIQTRKIKTRQVDNKIYEVGY